VDTHIVSLLQEALAHSGIQATHTLIHDILHHKFKYKKSKKVLSAEEKENLLRRQHTSNRSQEVRDIIISYLLCKVIPTANSKQLQKRTRRAKGFADLQRVGDLQFRQCDSREWQHILSKPQYHLSEVLPERGTDSREILVYDIAGRSQEVEFRRIILILLLLLLLFCLLIIYFPSLNSCAPCSGG